MQEDLSTVGKDPVVKTCDSLEEIMSNSRIATLAVLLSVLALVVGVLVLACGSSTNSRTETGNVIAQKSDCGGYVHTQQAKLASEDQTCIEWNYSVDGVLSFVHYNAGFNCCTDVVASVDVAANIITVQVTESGDWCHCLCLFDIDYVLGEIPAGVYTLNIQEPYLPEGDTALVFVIELDGGESSGSYCVDRSQYPWEITTTATGALVGDASCKQASLEDTLDGLTCLEYTYDGSTLLMTHYNAVLNCCPVLVADVDVTASSIVITEIDSLENGGCDCICLYDLNYEINDLLPGEYVVTVVEPYIPDGSSVLQDTINLYFDSTGSFCVTRGQLP